MAAVGIKGLKVGLLATGTCGLILRLTLAQHTTHGTPVCGWPRTTLFCRKNVTTFS